MTFSRRPEGERMSRTLSLSIQNASERLRIVMLEPWGREFLLRLEEKLEITAWAGSAGAGLRLVESDNRTLVFVQGCSGVRVIKEGVAHDLDLGSNLPAPAPPTVTNGGHRDPMWDRYLDS
jgi:hypothetical protein